MKTLRVFLGIFLFFSPRPLSAADTYGLPNDLHEQFMLGLGALFNSNFDEAERALEPLREKQEKYPVLALGEVIRVWWRMTSNVLETDEAESKIFMDAATRANQLAEGKLTKKGYVQEQALLVLGTTLGLSSRWSAANRAWVPAYFRGIKAASYMERLLDKNPDAVDAYLTLGTFNYAKALISGKAVSPDQSEPPAETEGLKQLRTVYKDGTYFRLAAGLLLAGILTNDNPPEALPLLAELRETLPQSAFVHMVQITAYYNANDMEALTREAASFNVKIEDHAYSYDYYPQAHFANGLIHFKKKEWDEAGKEFNLAAQARQIKNPYCVWATLYHGYTLDASGHRERAKKEYRAVLEMSRRFASHDHARERLAKPFSPSDAEMTKVEL